MFVGFSEDEVADLNACFESASPQAILAGVFDRFDSRVTMAWGGGYEGMAMLDMAIALNPYLRVFTLNTEMLFEETLELIARCEARYGIRIEQYYPEPKRCSEMVALHGIELYRQSVDLRKLCCFVRKVEPMCRALFGFQGWLTALTRFQSAGRSDTQIFSIDHAHGGMMKICPLATWPPEKIWSYIHRKNVPYNALHDRGYPSIGCQPCTRESHAGDGGRDNRWWWEPVNFLDGREGDSKECGIHAKSGMFREME
jgi:phosphoadenylyl-sulfate reductase (thioredoxin)